MYFSRRIGKNAYSLSEHKLRDVEEGKILKIKKKKLFREQLNVSISIINVIEKKLGPVYLKLKLASDHKIHHFDAINMWFLYTFELNERDN